MELKMPVQLKNQQQDKNRQALKNQQEQPMNPVSHLLNRQALRIPVQLRCTLLGVCDDKAILPDKREALKPHQSRRALKERQIHLNRQVQREWLKQAFRNCRPVLKPREQTLEARSQNKLAPMRRVQLPNKRVQRQQEQHHCMRPVACCSQERLRREQ